MLRKKCLGCGATYKLSGSGRRQRFCETCHRTGRRLTALQPIENKGGKRRCFDTHTPPDISEFVRAQILAQKGKPNPIRFVLPDGRKGRVWLGVGGIDARHWRLNLAEADRIDRLAVARQRKTWPVDIMGSRRMREIDKRIRHGILAVEHVLIDQDRSRAVALQGDDYPLTFDADGSPELPSCLDRRPKPSLAQAA